MLPVRFTGFLCLALLMIGASSCNRSPEAKEARFLKRGQALLVQGDYTRAILEFRNAANAMPNDAEPYYQLGKAFLASQDVRNAVRALQKATALNPKHSEAQLKLAELMVRSRNEKVIEEAASRLETAFGQSPDNPEAIDTLAMAEWKLGKPENASERLGEALKRFPTHLASSVSLAQMKLATKDWLGAEEVLRKAVAEAPQSSPAEAALGHLYVMLRQPAKAEAELKKAVQLDPKNGNALLDLARIEIASGMLDEADRTCQQLAALPDKRYKPLHAMFLYQHGKRDAALAEFERLAKSDPKDRDARTRLAAAYLGMNRPASAEAITAAALKENPKDAEALEQRAELRLRSGNADGAEKDLKEVLRFKPDSANAHYLLSTVYARQLPHNQQQELQEAVKLSPAMLPARLTLAMSLVSKKQGQAALDLLNQAPESQKNTQPWMVGRNWALLSMSKYQEARVGIEEVLKNGRPSDALYQNVVLHSLEGDPAGARVSVEELLKRNAADTRAAELLMETYAAQQQLSQGVARLKELAAANPQSARLQQLVGEWSRRAGDATAARRAFESAKAADARYVPADLALAGMDLADGRGAEAAQRLKTVVGANPKNVDALLLSAQAQKAMGDHVSEIASYRMAVNVEPSNVAALNNLAYTLAVNNPDEALKFGQQAAEIAPDNAYVQDTLGWIYYRKGLYTIAVQHLKAAVDKEATPQRRFHLGMTYLKVGDQTNGLKIVRDALEKDPNLMKTEQGW